MQIFAVARIPGAQNQPLWAYPVARSSGSLLSLRGIVREQWVRFPFYFLKLQTSALFLVMMAFPSLLKFFSAFLKLKDPFANTVHKRYYLSSSSLTGYPLIEFRLSKTKGKRRYYLKETPALSR